MITNFYDWDMRRLNRRDVALIFDVPPWLIGLYDDPAEERADRRWWRRMWLRRKYRQLRGWLRK